MTGPTGPTGQQAQLTPITTVIANTSYNSIGIDSTSTKLSIFGSGTNTTTRLININDIINVPNTIRINNNPVITSSHPGIISSFTFLNNLSNNATFLTSTTTKFYSSLIEITIPPYYNYQMTVNSIPVSITCQYTSVLGAKTLQMIASNLSAYIVNENKVIVAQPTISGLYTNSIAFNLTSLLTPGIFTGEFFYPVLVYHHFIFLLHATSLNIRLSSDTIHQLVL